MIGLLTIELKALRFYSYHGLYAEEKKTGNEFEVSVLVAHAPVSGTITDLSETIDYADLYNLVKNEMDQPRELLETLAMEIAEIIHSRYKGIKKVEVTIIKLHLPIAQFAGRVSVTYSKQF